MGSIPTNWQSGLIEPAKRESWRSWTIQQISPGTYSPGSTSKLGLRRGRRRLGRVGHASRGQLYRPLGDASHMRAAVAQAFDERRNGWVLRQDEFPWNENRDGRGRQPHLPADLADRCVATVKTVAARHVRLRRSSSQRRRAPIARRRWLPLRGTLAQIGGRSLLHSRGYLPRVGRHPHGHVPAPIGIVDHHGDSDPRRTFEVLSLTKLNRNSGGYAKTMPITLRFSRL